MSARDDVDRQMRRTAVLAVALFAALCFGIVVLAGGDWLPGALIVASALVALARLIPVINRLRRPPPPPPRSRPTA